MTASGSDTLRLKLKLNDKNESSFEMCIRDSIYIIVVNFVLYLYIHYFEYNFVLTFQKYCITMILSVNGSNMLYLLADVVLGQLV